jgi:hypothetical protein
MRTKNATEIHKKLHFSIGLFIYFLFTLYIWKNFWIHPGSVLQSETGDPALTLWSLAAVSKDLTEFKLPFFSNMLWVPKGVNLLDNTTEPLLGVISFPITLLFGPLWSYLILGTIGTFLNAASGWYLCSRITGVNLASYFGGLIAGFNPFLTGSAMFGQYGILYSSIPMIGISALLNIYFLKKKDLKYFLIFGATIVFEVLVSPEILAIEITGILIVGIFLLLFYPKTFIKEFKATYKNVLISLSGSLIVLLYPLYFILKGPQHLSKPPWGVSQSVFGVNWEQSVILPNSIGHLSGFLYTAGYFGPSPAPAGYMGIPLFVLLILGMLFLCFQRHFRFLIGIIFISVWLTTGSIIYAGSNKTYIFNTPLKYILIWKLLSRLPVISSIIPQRFSIMFWVAAAMLLSTAINIFYIKASAILSKTKLKTNVVFILLYAGLLSVLLPVFKAEELPIVTSKISVPGCFYDFNSAPYNAKTFLVVPFAGVNGSAEAMAWDALAGLPVKLVGGYIFIPDHTGAPLKLSPKTPGALGVLASITDTGVKPNYSLNGMLELKSALNAWNVSYILLEKSKLNFLNYAYFDRLVGRTPKVVSGCWIWNVLRN